MISTTIRLDEGDVRALKRARAAGHSASDLVRKGLRVVASRYYGRRLPSTLLFESTDTIVRVPTTAVDENYSVECREDEVRYTWQIVQSDNRPCIAESNQT